MRPRLPATLLGKVDEINTALATHASELASLDAALRAAGERVAAAIAAAEQAQARENAKEIKKLLTEAAAAQDINDALGDFVASTFELRDAANALHSRGCGFPSHAQIESIGTRVVLAALGQSIFKRGFETLAPNQRRQLAPTVAEWIATIERNNIR
jgi:hypothetical protein